jgi:hypothetical protein
MRQKVQISWISIRKLQDPCVYKKFFLTFLIIESVEWSSALLRGTFGIYRIWCSQSSGYGGFYLLGYRAAYSVKSQQTYRRNTWPQSPWSKNKWGKKSTWSRQQYLLRRSVRRRVRRKRWLIFKGLHGVYPRKCNLHSVHKLLLYFSLHTNDIHQFLHNFKYSLKPRRE